MTVIVIKIIVMTISTVMFYFCSQDANEEDIKVQVCVFMFDLLYLNDEPLVKEPFVKRRELLKQHFKEVEGEWKFANNLDASTMEEVEVFWTNL